MMGTWLDGTVTTQPVGCDGMAMSLAGAEPSASTWPGPPLYSPAGPESPSRADRPALSVLSKALTAAFSAEPPSDAGDWASGAHWMPAGPRLTSGSSR